MNDDYKEHLKHKLATGYLNYHYWDDDLSMEDWLDIYKQRVKILEEKISDLCDKNMDMHIKLSESERAYDDLHTKIMEVIYGPRL